MQTFFVKLDITNFNETLSALGCSKNVHAKNHLRKPRTTSLKDTNVQMTKCKKSLALFQIHGFLKKHANTSNFSNNKLHVILTISFL